MNILPACVFHQPDLTHTFRFITSIRRIYMKYQCPFHASAVSCGSSYRLMDLQRHVILLDIQMFY
jgi:hypothetical protein